MALTGLAFVVLGVVSFTIVGDVPTPGDDSAREIVRFYEDNGTQVGIGSVLACLAGVLAVVFGLYVRSVLRAAQPDPEGDFAPLALVIGLAIFATGLAIDSALNVALLDTAGDVSPVATVALSAIWNNDFPVFATGLFLANASLAVSILRYGALPKWLGWVAVLLIVVTPTPIGFAGFLGTLVFMVVISVLLAVRGRRAATSGPAGPAAETA
jgi:hypothetical protein